MGIEPTLSAWEAEVLPLNYTRKVVLIKVQFDKPFCKFLTYDFYLRFGGNMEEIEQLPRASFTSFADSTKEDWHLIMSQRGELEAALPGRILNNLSYCEMIMEDFQ